MNKSNLLLFVKPFKSTAISKLSERIFATASFIDKEAIQLKELKLIFRFFV